MVNLIAPPAVIFINADLSENVLTTIQRQLFISETMTGEEFDNRVAIDPNYITEIHGSDARVLVIRSFMDYTNRDLADIVIFAKAGLASVEMSKMGPPGITFSIDRMYLSQLFFTMNTSQGSCDKCKCQKEDCLQCCIKTKGAALR